MSESITTESVDTNPNTTNVNNINIDNLETQTKVSEQPIVQLGRYKLMLVMLGLAFSIILSIMDQTIVSTILPAIASEFKAFDKIEWVTTSYLLTMTVVQPTYGKLSDIFGRKETFIFAIIVFEIGSLLCGLAPNITSMIIFRAIAGIGCGGIESLIFIIISDIVSLQDRGKYQGIISAAIGIAAVVGPLLGGAFTDHVTWRWSFYINLPFGAVTLVAVIFFHTPRPKGSLLQKLKRIDYAGTIVIVGATVALLLSLNWGGNEYAWNSPVIITLLVVGGFGYLLFAFIEAKFAIEPIVPLHLFKQLHIVSCFVANILQLMALYGFVFYYVPLYFQVVRGDSATESGLALSPYILGYVIAAVGTGQIVSRTDILSYRTISSTGAAFITIGAGFISLWNENTGRGPQIIHMIISGIGIGAIMQATILYAQGIVEYKDVAVVTALLMFFRSIGSVFGVAIVGSAFSNALSQNLEHISISLDQIKAVKKSPALVHQLDEEIRGPVIVAYVNALRTAFVVVIPIGILCFISTIFMGNYKPKINKKGNSDTNII